jgi:aspartyl aminopeptidase
MNITIFHPCPFREKHESNHQPQLHRGVVLKYNANQRYATTAITASVIREVAAKCKVPIQVRRTS